MKTVKITKKQLKEYIQRQVRKSLLESQAITGVDRWLLELVYLKGGEEALRKRLAAKGIKLSEPAIQALIRSAESKELPPGVNL